MGLAAADRVSSRKMPVWPVAAYGVIAGLYAGAPRGSWSWFSYHPAAMTISFVALGASATLVKKRGGYGNTKLHGAMMTAAVALAAFGWYVIYSNKELLKKPHLTSWHAWISVVALVGYAALFVVGLLGLHPDFGLRKTNKLVRYSHKYGGRVATAIGWFAIVLGFNKMHADESVLKLLFAAPLAIASCVILL